MRKILVIGSGPIVIGQAAEFDYAGTQACKSLREEGFEVVLVNSNPATIMTDEETADAVYIEPLTPEFCERVIARERPDGLLPTLGGQTGLNLATELSHRGVLERYGVRLLGTPLSAIQRAEDREQFRTLMREIREPVPESWIIESAEELEAILDTVPYPCIIRPAYTLGGTGGGIANDRDALWEIGNNGLKLSMRSQVMVERSLLGWKEVEYEVMRDSKGNCITICNMENLDPMGVHTGDSIVVAPSQTLSDIEYHMLRTASLKIIRALGIEGGCNVQLAVNPQSFDYYVIEVNPRVSRSSALASKATGYPIARVAAKIAVGRTLDEIDNAVTGTTKACFEPALDYCVVKIPRWPFDKFPSGDRTLFTQMKATGEVMAIDRSFEAALMKAIRGLEIKQKDLRHPKFSPPWQGRPAPGSEGVSPSDFGEGDRRYQGAFLPHWREKGAVYSVTWRLADALPVEAQRLLELEQQATEYRAENVYEGAKASHERRRAMFYRMDELLDRGYGSRLLSDHQYARSVLEAIRHFDGQRYEILAAAVMPTHVHVIVRPFDGFPLEKTIHSWKSFTGHALKRSSGLERIWQAEYFDRIIRGEEELAQAIAYVIDNPKNAGLDDWPFVYSGRDALRPRGETPLPQDGTTDEELRHALRKPTDERLWAIAEALRRGWSIADINRLSRVDPWFLEKIRILVDIEIRLVAAGKARETRGRAGMELSQLVYHAFLAGYPSPSILSMLDADLPDEFGDLVRREVDRLKVQPVFKMVDTCAGEFESRTPYYYGTFESEDDAIRG